jgi:hypothetical protein
MSTGPSTQGMRYLRSSRTPRAKAADASIAIRLSPLPCGRRAADHCLARSRRLLFADGSNHDAATGDPIDREPVQGKRQA